MSKKIIWDYFKSKGFTECGISGLMGNLQAESNFKPQNLQNTGNKKLNMTDEEYTKAVDNGTYSFDLYRKDGHGFGLAQWTFHTRKAALYNFAKKCNKSIGDLQMQLDYLYKELQGYKEVFKVLKTATTVREASDIVLLRYERPKDQSERVQLLRCGYGEAIYKEFSKEAQSKVLYRVQVGAYSVKANAEAMMQKLKKAGYDAILVEVK